MKNYHFVIFYLQIRDMKGIFIVVVKQRDTNGDDVITSCEYNKTVTTNGINITTTVQNGQLFGQTFKYVSSLLILNRFIIYSNESFLWTTISKDMVNSF